MNTSKGDSYLAHKHGIWGTTENKLLTSSSLTKFGSRDALASISCNLSKRPRTREHGANLRVQVIRPILAHVQALAALLASSCCDSGVREHQGTALILVLSALHANFMA